jgi:hypothetical protein
MHPAIVVAKATRITLNTWKGMAIFALCSYLKGHFAMESLTGVSVCGSI